MSGDSDSVPSKTIEVEIQSNGIIRNKHGWFLARLDKDIEFEFVEGQPCKFQGVEAHHID
jgi:hypothetical protein